MLIAVVFHRQKMPIARKEKSTRRAKFLEWKPDIMSLLYHFSLAQSNNARARRNGVVQTLMSLQTRRGGVKIPPRPSAEAPPHRPETSWAEPSRNFPFLFFIFFRGRAQKKNCKGQVLRG